MEDKFISNTIFNFIKTKNNNSEVTEKELSDVLKAINESIDNCYFYLYMVQSEAIGTNFNLEKYKLINNSKDSLDVTKTLEELASGLDKSLEHIDTLTKHNAFNASHIRLMVGVILNVAEIVINLEEYLLEKQNKKNINETCGFRLYAIRNAIGIINEYKTHYEKVERFLLQKTDN